MLKNEYACLLLDSELDNAGTDQMCDLFINVSDLAPQIGIVLLVLGEDTSLRSVACDASEQSRALCPLSLCHFR